ncbi:hypothetical protein DC522_18430 [Microvirga sp. KLBC 81]|uniref:VOC family protein n=1 Tax=Microvirga sp. KLBC 81 TaxID=1862707 RepID=UPI000D523C77|nr:VOC family protein [Microvirga sp. KLBC 81]PVE22964.1 hypothetical protein DC522_18430 [Microvirga sp. KLBC 81]
MLPASGSSLEFSFLGQRMQMGFVVKDLDAALRYWTEVLNVGPFVVIGNAIAGRRVVYRGSETNMELTLAFAYMGDVQIELVYPSNDAASQYKEYIESGREGLHHVAYWPERFESVCSRLEASGFSEVCSVYGADGKRAVVHYDPPGHIGVMIELVPSSPARLAYFSRMQRLAAEWDGARPIRRYDSLDAFLASGEGADG